jgi:hypothetical protein
MFLSFFLLLIYTLLGAHCELRERERGTNFRTLHTAASFMYFSHPLASFIEIKTGSAYATR